MTPMATWAMNRSSLLSVLVVKYLNVACARDLTACPVGVACGCLVVSRVVARAGLFALGGATSFKNREKAALEPQLPETRPQRPIYRPGRIPLDARAVWCCFWGPMSPKAPSSGLKPAF